MLNLNALNMNALVSIVNALGGEATVKTFSQRSKAIARITKLAQMKNIDLNNEFDADGKPVVKEVPAPAAEKAPKKVKAPKEPKAPKEKKVSIRSVAEALIAKVVGEEEGAPVGLSYEDILAEVKSQFPAAKTTVGCLRWYAVRMREAGVVLPKRARAAKPVVEAPVADPVVETPVAEVAAPVAEVAEEAVAA